MDAVRAEGTATHPTSTSLPHTPAQPPQCAAPARAPCHRESLPKEDECEQEDEEAGGEEQLGWEGRKRWFRHGLRSQAPEEASPLYGSSILTQDLHAAIANAMCSILAPVDAEKQEAQN